MVSCALFVLCPLWIPILTQACRGEELSREVVLSWFRERVLEGLGLEEPPLTTAPGPDRDVAQPEARQAPRGPPSRTSRIAWVNRQTSPAQDTSQIILFPGSDSSCTPSAPGETTNNHFTYYFQPSMNNLEMLVTSAHFWFYAGEGANSSAQLFILNAAAQRLLRAAEAAPTTSADGWSTWELDRNPLASVARGPFLLQVRCPACQCHRDEPDKTPFLHLRAQPRGPVRSPRHAPGTFPWAPSAVDLFQRPSRERPEHSNCLRAKVEVSFEELGWGHWIVHPRLLTFYYCSGNCSAGDRTATMLGMTQCCAPVPETMKSLRVTTTSDGGYSFKYETLPNIIPEECACI